MKICWDNLEKLRYSHKTKKWYQGNATYILNEGCKNCGESFLQAYDSKFCSVQCSNVWIKDNRRIIIKCLNCGGIFKVIPYYKNRLFCNEKCSHKYMKKENHPMYNKHHSENSKRKMSKAHIDKILSEKHKKNIGKSQIGFKHSEKTKTKIRKSHLENNEKNGHWMQTKEGRKILSERAKWYIGENNPNWKGGVSIEPYCHVWSDKQYKESIKERDYYKCQNPSCNNKSDKLTGHHINYNKKNCAPGNIITLCVSCNGRANANRKSWSRFYKHILDMNSLK